MKNFLSIVCKVVLFLCITGSAIAQVCHPGLSDTIQFMAPQISTYNGHFNMVYPTAGFFYWVKGANGYPWDLDTFDRKFVYQKATELVWNDPHTFKRFQKPMPWMPRCFSPVPGKVATIKVPAQDTNFDIHVSCRDFTTQNLGNTINELLWEPPTLVLAYQYSCDENYQNCKYREIFSFTQAQGLTQWTYYILNNGVYLMQNQVTHNQLIAGSVTPIHPCWAE